MDDIVLTLPYGRQDEAQEMLKELEKYFHNEGVDPDYLWDALDVDQDDAWEDACEMYILRRWLAPESNDTVKYLETLAAAEDEIDNEFDLEEGIAQAFGSLAHRLLGKTN